MKKAASRGGQHPEDADVETPAAMQRPRRRQGRVTATATTDGNGVPCPSTDTGNRHIPGAEQTPLFAIFVFVNSAFRTVD